MSANDTNTEDEAKRHKPALLGIGGSIVWGAVLLVGLIVWITYNGNTPEEEGAQVEPGVGLEQPSDG